MRTFLVLFCTLIFGVSILPVRASTIKGGDQVTIAEDVQGNLYVAGGEINIEAQISGDLIGAGGKIRIADSILQDLLIAGGEITIDAVVGGDLRMMGGQIWINKDVMGDLIVSGGEITIGEGVTIFGDLIVAGGEINANCLVKGDVRMAGGELTLKGIIDGKFIARSGNLDLDAEIGGPSELVAVEMDLGPKALFKGDVRYWSKNGEVDFDQHLSEGAKATLDETLKPKYGDVDWKYLGFGLAAFALWRLLAAALLILLLIVFFHPFFRRKAGTVRENFGNYLGYGALYLIGVPVLTVFAFATLIGIPVGVILAGIYSASLVLGGALVSVIAAYEIAKYTQRDWNKGTLILVAIGVFFLLKLLAWLPVIKFVGGLLNFVLFAIAMGYLIYAFWKKPKVEEEEVAASDIV